MSQLESMVARKLKAMLPKVNVSEGKSLPSGKKIDLYATDGEDEYFIEIKETDCNRVVLGQIIDYYAELSRVHPQAKLMIVCRRVDQEVRDALKKLGIEILTFQDLDIHPDVLRRGKEESSLIELSPLEQTVYFSLQRKGLNIVQTRDLAKLLGKSHAYAKNLMVSLSRRGVLYRIGRGKYVVIPADVLYQRKGYVGDPFILIDQIMQKEKYYIGYQTAARFHGIAHQIPFDTSVAVLKQRRPIRLNTTRIRFIKINKKKFFGFSEVKYSEAFVKVSDIEKTVLDCLDRYDLCGGVLETTRMVSGALEKMNWDKLLKYLRKMNNRALTQRLGFILEKLSKKKVFKIPEEVLRRVEELAGPYTYLLDASSPGQGKISKKWHIIENKNCMSWYRHA